jgi:hypothetical protein
VLPEVIAEDYEYARDLRRPSAEADLVLLRSRWSASERVLKLYRASHRGLDPAILTTLMERGKEAWRHVVRIYAFEPGDDGRPAWELQEYCPVGTLTDWRLRMHGGPGAKLIVMAVRRLAPAVEYLHSLGIVHRDLKPDNVLVRGHAAMTMPLTDFGLATHQEDQIAARTVAGSWGFMAPEAAWGEVGPAGDWWSLGAIVYELATGRGLFARPDGSALPDPQVRLLTGRGAYSTEAIRSRRVRLLADGLLTYDPADRWGMAEVREWLRGHSPPVRGRGGVATVGTAVGAGSSERSDRRSDRISDGLWADEASRNTGLRQTPTRVPVTVLGSTVRSAAELAALARERWEEAADLLAGRMPQDLEAWLERTQAGRDAMEVLAYGGTGGARLVRFIGVLDPSGPPVFRGVELTEASLGAQIAAARQGDRKATAWLRRVREEHILTAWGVASGSAALAEADSQMAVWADQATDEFGRDLAGARWHGPSRIPRDMAQEVTADGSPFEGLLFAAALQGQTLAIEQAARTAAARPPKHALAAGKRAALRDGRLGRDLAWGPHLARRVREAPSEKVGLFLVAALALPAFLSQLEAANEVARRERRATGHEWRALTVPLRLGAAALYLDGLAVLRHFADWAPGPEPWIESFGWAWREAGLTTGIALAASLIVTTGLVRARPSHLAAQIIMTGIAFGGVPALTSIPWTAEYQEAAPWAAQPHGFGAWPLWVAGASLVAGLAALRAVGRRSASPVPGRDRDDFGIGAVFPAALYGLAPLVFPWISLFANTRGPGQLTDLLDSKFEPAAAFVIGGWGPEGFRWPPLMILAAIIACCAGAIADDGAYHRLQHRQTIGRIIGICAAVGIMGLAALVTPGASQSFQEHLQVIGFGQTPAAGHWGPALTLAVGWVIAVAATEHAVDSFALDGAES